LFAFTGIASTSGGVGADKYPVTLHGSGEITFAAPSSLGGALFLACEHGTFTSGTFEAPSREFSTTSLGCIGPNNVEMGACHFEFSPATASFGIGPIGCGGVTASGYPCILKIFPQTGMSATYEGSRIRLNATKAKYESLSESNCGTKGSVHETLAITGTLDVSGTDSGGKADKVYVSSQLPVGVYLHKFGEAEKLDAQGYPVIVRGEAPSGSSNITLLNVSTIVGKTPLVCERLASGSLTTSVGELKLIEPSGCEIFGEPLAVNPHQCLYALGLPSGHAEIRCQHAGEAIEFLNPELCSFSIPAQSLAGTIKSENVGEGANEAVKVQDSGTGVAFTKSGPACSLVTGTTGSFSFNFPIHGTFAG
jgi:hypothetical protein